MQRLRNLFVRRRQKLDPGIVRVTTSDDGFEGFTGDGKVETVKWSEVEKICTYKVDCYAYDLTCLAFERRGHEGALHIREETEGFQDLMSALARVFPDLNPEWCLDVMQPAFAEQLAVLFERPNRSRDLFKQTRREKTMNRSIKLLVLTIIGLVMRYA